MDRSGYVSDAMGAKEARAFGNWLNARIDALGITPAELARLAGVSQSMLSRYRTYEQTPGPLTIAKLAKALRSDEDELLALAGHRGTEADGGGEDYVLRTSDPDTVEIFDAVEDLSVADKRKVQDLLKTLFPRVPGPGE